MMRRSFLSPLVLVTFLAGAVPAVAHAAPVRGTVTLPAELKTARRFFGHWRVENNAVPIAPAPVRGDTIVFLVGIKAQSQVPKSVPVEISGLQATPPAVVVPEGSTVEFHNSDKVAHELTVSDHTDVMSPERLAAGSVRKVRFGVPGEYVVRCTEYPHLTISVIVTSSPLYAPVEEKGAFKMPDVPEGHGTLKVWSYGRWVHEEEVDVTSKGLELSIKVAGTANKEPNE